MSVSQTLRSRPKIEEGIYFSRLLFWVGKKRRGAKQTISGFFFFVLGSRAANKSTTLESSSLDCPFLAPATATPTRKGERRNPSAHISTEKKKNPHSRVREPRRRMVFKSSPPKKEGRNTCRLIFLGRNEEVRIF